MATETEEYRFLRDAVMRHEAQITSLMSGHSDLKADIKGLQQTMSSINANLLKIAGGGIFGLLLLALNLAVMFFVTN